MDYFVTNQKVRYEHRTAKTYRKPGAEMRLVKVYPEIRKQTVTGFGGALTEASAYVYSRLDADKRRELMELYYGENGSRYNLGRVSIQSCDFSLGNRAYVEEGDTELRTFSIQGDRTYVIPLVKAALAAAPELRLLASPWSPPAFMKSSGQMNRGGRLLEEYYGAWAKIMVQYLLAYREEGIVIDRITVQNEPAATQTWESCLYSGVEEAIFAVNFLRRELDAAGLTNVKIFVWDHNKDRIIERCRESFSVPGADAAVGGIAFHWYTGDHFPALDYVRGQYPDKEILFTEGCAEYRDSPGRGTVSKAESYAHSLIGDFNAGMNGFMDWNIVLDKQGGPNHVQNFCEAPIMCDLETGTLTLKQSYYYIGHFSRYIRRGARVLLSTSFTKNLECAAFENPDGERIVVILNSSDRPQRFALLMDGDSADITLEAHSIMTAVAG